MVTSSGVSPEMQAKLAKMSPEQRQLVQSYTPELRQKVMALSPETNATVQKMYASHTRHSDTLTFRQVMQEVLADYQNRARHEGHGATQARGAREELGHHSGDA